MEVGLAGKGPVPKKENQEAAGAAARQKAGAQAGAPKETPVPGDGAGRENQGPRIP